jgi:hypothetical protein
MRSSARDAARQAARTSVATASQASIARITIASVESNSWVTVFSYLLPIAVDTTFNTSFGHGTEFLYANQRGRVAAPTPEVAS